MNDALAGTQRERVLEALRNAGDRGITSVDFMRYPTFDRKPPITRLAARIEELRSEGYQIDSSQRRQRCSVYRLVEALQGSVAGVDATSPSTATVAGPSPAAPPAAEPTLFDMPARTPSFDEICPPVNAILGEEAA